MRDPAQFDEFYKDVRTRLLLLTYCLTGDLPSSRAAVRDAFVQSWHHWRKISRIEDAEAWTRVRACGDAQRRHTAKLWHREKGLDAGVKATLDALGKLPVTQRKVLLLTELTTSSLAEIAREVGLPRAEAERELQLATAQFSMLRDVPTTSIRLQLEPVRAHVEDTRWPRATIIRRSGAARRRTHTAIGGAAAAAALVVTGTLVSDAGGVRPTLAGDRVEPAGSSAGPSARPTSEPVDLPEDSLLVADRIDRVAPGGGWFIAGTDSNSEGDGLVMPCQDSRYADPRGTAALLREFQPTGSGRKATATAFQAAQASATPRAASRGFRTALDWFAACDLDRAQLLDTRRVQGVGDEAMLVLLRTWGDPGSTVVAGVARTGLFTTATVVRTPVADEPSLRASAKLLGDAVAGLCTLPEGGACALTPTLKDTAPVPVASVPGMLAEVDLPPVPGVAQPWVGTEPRQARDNDAATGCDDTDFSTGSVTNNVTRTFLVPGARLADQFGLTETVGSLPEARAKAFVTTVRDKLATCTDKAMGTDVSRVQHLATKHRDLTVWRVTTEISDDKTLTYLMGIVRDRTSIAQLGFVPDPEHSLAPGAFPALAERALARLDAMPPPKTG
jgi:DNA-directed RNA polymerase specialized sigma24 family protein